MHATCLGLETAVWAWGPVALNNQQAGALSREESLLDRNTPQADPKGGPWLEDRDALKDPWNVPFMYDRTGPRNNGRKPDIWTKGPDGVELGNWPANPQ